MSPHKPPRLHGGFFVSRQNSTTYQAYRQAPAWKGGDSSVSVRLGPDRKNFVPKTRLVSTIQYLRVAVIYPLFRKSPIYRFGGEGELEEFRDTWLHWLNDTPRANFLSYHDAYHQFIADLESGVWCPFAPPKPASKAALDALRGVYNQRSPSGPTTAPRMADF